MFASICLDSDRVISVVVLLGGAVNLVDEYFQLMECCTICSVLGRATAQHMQDYPIFFIQLNYVHNNRRNKKK